MLGYVGDEGEKGREGIDGWGMGVFLFKNFTENFIWGDGWGGRMGRELGVRSFLSVNISMSTGWGGGLLSENT